MGGFIFYYNKIMNITLSTGVTIDLEDVLHEMSTEEKFWLAEELSLEMEEPVNMEFPITAAEGQTENELMQSLESIWNNRMFITKDNIETLNQYGIKGDYGI